MKYWWLDKYRRLEVKMLPDLFSDIQYFLVVPKHYEQIYKQIEKLDVSTLSEEEMCLCLYYLSVTRKVCDHRLAQIIERLLVVPDTSLPISDYSLSEILEEISNLKKRAATVDKLNYNNVAACYSCLNVFYVDKIKSSDKKGKCLCPFCHRKTLYFDNDLVPMNYSFLFMSRLFYGVSSMGCDFSRIQKMIKKGIIVGESFENSKTPQVLLSKSFQSILFSFQKKIIQGEDESKIIKGFNDSFLSMEKQGIYEIVLEFPWKSEKNLFEIAYLLILSCISSLTNFFYLKKIFIVTRNLSLIENLNFILKKLSITKKNYLDVYSN